MEVEGALRELLNDLIGSWSGLIDLETIIRLIEALLEVYCESKPSDIFYPTITKKGTQKMRCMKTSLISQNLPTLCF